MELIIGKTAGFCYGVKRAVEGAKKEIAEITNKDAEKISCLGELVHNRQVIEELENQGIKFIENIEEAKDTIIIRAHGTTKQTYEEAEKRNIKIKDYTCPNVLKIHKIAEEYRKLGYFILLCGSSKHPENMGTLSYCGENVYVIEKEDDAIKAIDKILKSKIQKILLIAQTTYSLEKFYIIEEILKNELPKNIELTVDNTICTATELRQKETEKISKEVECMIIIGGKNSSNTKKLYEIAKKYCNMAICIETKDEIDLKQLQNFEKVGIMAGASTPNKSIEDVKKILLENKMYHADASH